MNLTLTMQFATLDELQTFLNRNPAARVEKVASTQPSAEVVSLPIADPVSAAPVAVDPVSAAPVADPGVLRADLMARLRALAEKMEGPGELGKFINNFGVSRFSELPDDQLAAFNAALASEYGA